MPFDRARPQAAIPAPFPFALHRRAFLEGTGKGLALAGMGALLPACGGGGSEAGTGASTPPPTEMPPVLPAPDAAYVQLRRVSYGVSQAHMAEASNDIEGYLEAQLRYDMLDDQAVEEAIAFRFPNALRTPEALRAGFPANQQQVVADLISATLLRRFYSPRQLFEQMVEMWGDHFNIHIRNGIGPILHPAYDFETLRPHAMGSFRALLGATARSPAMLFYLDNFLNQRTAPNENYARELMELHTLGVDGGFSEDDVKEVARCFTGWSLDFRTGRFRFIPALHDDDEKQVLGTTIPASGGQRDGEIVLDLLAAHPSTARHVAERICRRFLADTPDTSDVEAVAAAFAGSGGDIPTALRAAMGRPGFRATADTKTTRPVEFLGQLVRTLRASDTLPSDEAIRLIYGMLDILGQVPFFWAPPDGYPDEGAFWRSTSGLLNRWRIALGLTALAETGAIDLAATVATAETVADAVDMAAARVVVRAIADPDRNRIIDYLVGEIGGSATSPQSPGTLRALAPLIIALLASAPYLQLR
ncbi:DUF1800 domain-containing protein [Algiphilus sp.]|uniref:DUF1800 domain-containing protein n=1 Tax=Algiphilus sp. TaxID=1872431 RepID=UPI003B52B43A